MSDSAKVSVCIAITSGWNNEMVAEVSSTIIDPSDLESEVSLAVGKAENDIERIMRARRKLDEAIEASGNAGELTA